MYSRVLTYGDYLQNTLSCLRFERQQTRRYFWRSLELYTCYYYRRHHHRDHLVRETDPKGEEEMIILRGA